MVQWSQAKVQYEKTAADLAEMENEIKVVSTELVAMEQSLEKMAREKDRGEKETEKLKKKLKEAQEREGACKTVLQQLSQAHVWIASERSYFGASGSCYDFNTLDIAALRRRQAEASKEQVRGMKPFQ